MTDTLYHVRDDTGQRWSLRDAERAERLSRAGLRVTAETGIEDVVVHA